MRNRTRNDILIDMLQAADSPITKTGMMYKCMLSYEQLKYYHEYLKEAGLIEQSERKKWIVTGKGRTFMERYNDAIKMLATGPALQGQADQAGMF
jgi:predicted transcriptional regulator